MDSSLIFEKKMITENKLSEEDQTRIEKYLSHSIHQVERKPFRPWLLLLVVILVMTGLSLFSYVIAYLHGVV